MASRSIAFRTRDLIGSIAEVKLISQRLIFYSPMVHTGEGEIRNPHVFNHSITVPPKQSE